MTNVRRQNSIAGSGSTLGQPNLAAGQGDQATADSRAADHQQGEPRQHAREHAAEARRQGEQAKAGLSGTAEETKQQAQQAAAEAQRAAQEAGEQMRESAARAADQTRQQVASAAGRQKEWVGEELRHVGEAMRSAANHLHETDDDRVASYVDMAADQLDSTAQYLRQRDIRGLVDDLDGFARRRPEVFLGGMFLAGLGISRFLGASRREDSAATATADRP